METRALGKDGPQVSMLCLGTWPIAGGLGPVQEDQGIATVKAAIEAGMTFLDTAEDYRTSESLIGEAIAGQRDKVFIASKVSYHYSFEAMSRSLDNSLKALRTDYIDLYQLHEPKAKYSIEESMESLLRLRETGKIRYLGLSNYLADQVREALTFGPINSVQPPYNMMFRFAERTLVPCCLENGIGIIPYSVLGRGMLSGKYRPGVTFPPGDERHGMGMFEAERFQRTYQVIERWKQWALDHGRDLLQLSIAWMTAQPAVTAPIVGAKSPEQVHHIVKAADWRLTPSDLKEIDEIRGDLPDQPPIDDIEMIEGGEWRVLGQLAP